MTIRLSNIHQTFRNSSIRYDGLKLNINVVASAANSTAFRLQNTNTDLFVVYLDGSLYIKGPFLANNTVGSAGQVLTSNGNGTYWSTVAVGGGGTVTSVATGNGLTGGPITGTGTISVVANSGIVATSDGLFVNSAYIALLAANSTTYVPANTGIVSNSSGVFVNSAYINTISSNLAYYVLANTGIVSNSSGVFVNSAYINTISSNLAYYVLANTGIVSNSSGVFVNASYINTISANNASYLGTVAAASYVQNTDSRTLSGNLNFTGTNTVFAGKVGIGMTPTMPLEVTAAASPAQGIFAHLYNTGTANGAYMQFTQSLVADWAIGTKGSSSNFVINSGKNTATAGTDVFTITTTGDTTIAGTLTLGPQDNINEGAQINWTSANTWQGWYTDLFQNVFRIFTSGASNSQVQIFNSGGGGVAGLYVHGNTGIGTSSPDAKLKVVTSTLLDGIVLTDATRSLTVFSGTAGSGSWNGITPTNGIGLMFHAGSQNTGTFVIAPWASGTSGLAILGANGNIGVGNSSPGQRFQVDGGNIIVRGANNFGGTGDNPKVYLGDTANYVDSVYGGYARLAGYNGVEIGSTGTGSYVSKVTIQASSNVGINQTSPTARLDVVGPANAFTAKFSDGTVTSGIFNGNNSVRTGGFIGTISNHPLYFYTNSNDAQVMLAANGNFGIGTTTPASKLHVEGADAQVNNGTSTSSLYLGNKSSTYGALQWDGTNNRLYFNANGGFYIYVKSDGTLYTAAPVGTAHFDSSGASVSMANNATQDFPNQSGLIIVNNIYTGAVMVWVGGGGSTSLVGSVGTVSGTYTYNSGVAGYRFTNTSGATHTYAFMLLKTRGTA